MTNEAKDWVRVMAKQVARGLRPEATADARARGAALRNRVDDFIAKVQTPELRDELLREFERWLSIEIRFPA